MDLPPCRQKGSRFFYSIHRIHCETREKQKMTQESSDYFLLKKKKLLATATMTRKLPNPPVCSVAASKKKKRVNISFDFAPTAVFLPFSLVVIYVLIPLIPLNGRQADKRGKTPMVGRQTRSSWTKMATAIDWVEGFRRFGWNSKSFFFVDPRGPPRLTWPLAPITSVTVTVQLLPLCYAQLFSPPSKRGKRATKQAGSNYVINFSDISVFLWGT